ncbi:PAS domain S-box protein [Thermodesulfobacteriota bacterium]
MTIKRKFLIATVIAVGLASVIFAIIIFTSTELKRAMAEEQLATEMFKAVFDLNVLTNEHLRHPSEKIRLQWQSKHNDINDLLDTDILFSPTENDIILLLRKNNIETRDAFTKLTEISKREEDLLSLEINDKLVKQIMTRLYEMDLKTGSLSQEARTRLSKQQGQMTYLVASTAFLLALIVLLISLFVLKKVIMPILELRDRADVIGKGEINQSIEIKSDDEIGALADSFNKMTINLRSYMDKLEMKKNELKESEEKYRAFIEGTDDLITQVDANGNLLYVNHASEKIFGLKPAECIGKSAFQFIHPEDRIATQESFKSWAESKPPSAKYGNRQVNSNGEIFHMLWNMNLHYDEKGDIKIINGIARDMTNEIIAQSEKEELRKQFLQSQKMETVGLLSGRISHDFNNMLTPIVGFSRIVYDRLPEDSSEKDMVKRIYNSGKKAANLIDQLLMVSKRQVLENRVCNLTKIIRDMSDLFLTTTGEDVKLNLIADTEVNNIMGDVTQIEQVMLNLAVNARQAMPNGGTLTIEVKDVLIDDEYVRVHQDVHKGNYVVLSVGDTGVGMSPEVQMRIFEPFFTTKGEDKGTGLGLSTVYGIVKQHNGFIWAYSELGEGTIFKIYFPAFQAEIKEEAIEEVQINVEGSETILVVDDKPIIHQMIGQILQPKGYNVLEAENADEAIKAYSAYDGDVNLLITDVVMPDMNGWELYKKIKALNPKIKVLFASGFVESPIVLFNIQEKGYPFIKKPLDPHDLLRKIRIILDKQA